MQIALLLLVSSFLCRANGIGPRKLYSLTFPTNVVSVKAIGRKIFFIGPWYIGVIDNVKSKFQQKSRMNVRVMNKDIPNPRMIGKVPVGTFKGSKEAAFWVTTWGANETSGAVYILKLTSHYSEWADISIDDGWNYERTQWLDMDRDGLKDCLTARFRGGVGQMLWFKQPRGQTFWGQKIIHEGMADRNFLGFEYDKKTYILVAGNGFSTLGLYWTLHRKNNWLFSRQVRHRVIDNYGNYYDLQYIDLDKDGRPDVLTTTVQISSSRGQVLGYEIPYDIQNKIWPRRVLAAGFKGDNAPGKAIAFWANKLKRKTERPSIFLSGAGEEKLFILSPRPRTSGWGYIKSALTAGVGMIGIPYITDLNRDSYPEFFVPQGNQVHVFSYDKRTSSSNVPSQAPPLTRRATSINPPVRFLQPFYGPANTSPSPPALPGPIPPSSRSTIVNSQSSNFPFFGNSGNKPIFQQPSSSGSSNRQIPSSNGKGSNSNHLANPLLTNQNTQNRVIPFDAPNNHRNPFFENHSNQPKANFDASNLTPSNLVLSVTSKNFSFHLEASDACNNNNRVLCSLEQLQHAVTKGGAVPDFDWGWFAYEGRAVRVKECENGDIKWGGYFCYNGNMEISTIQSAAYLPALCCSVVNWATVTTRRFSRKIDAASECRNASKHLCSLDEMMTVWDESSYKGLQWGWFDFDNTLIRMSHYCDVNKVLWSGYQCIDNKFEVTEIRSFAQERAFCCPSRGQAIQASSVAIVVLSVLSLFLCS